MPTAFEAVRDYVAAWATVDDEARRRLLERAWADDGIYTDPQAHVEGREALIEHIGDFLRRADGARIVPISGVDEHHGRVRFAWRVEGAAPPPLAGLEGMDFGELAPIGRLRRIVGFFGPLPSLT